MMQEQYLPIFLDDLAALVACGKASKRDARELARIAFILHPSLREAK